MIPHDQAPEHEFEAAPGLPEPLPEGERLLWQGAPDWRVLARDALHVRAVSIYFGVLLLWRAATVASNGGGALASVQAALWLLPLAALGVAILVGMAWLVSRTSIYTITDRRVVMRIGIVLSITFNLPYSKIESVGMKADAAGRGDLSLLLDPADRIAYLHLWPHARPWQMRRTQPTLRALADVRSVGSVLSAALADAAGIARAPLPAPVDGVRQPAVPSSTAGSEGVPSLQYPLAA
ncbi:MAG: photosynthetic complex putative assembly protein PuhB [Caldimonas sp.]